MPDAELEYDPRQREGGRIPSRGVFGRLFREGYQFDFYQAVRLLELYFADAPPPGEGDELRRERIFFRADTALAFPATDVRHVALQEDPDRARMTLTFLGLYGVDSPLPVYFYDELSLDEPDTYPLRDFLDIFNHRLYSYFYRAWKKHRPQAYQRGAEAHDRRFLSLSGLGTPRALNDAVVPRMRLTAFAGLLSSRVHNAEGLRQLLSGLLGGLGVQVEEHIPRWVEITERPTMGRRGSPRMVLGASSTIGTRLFDIAGKFRVVLGPLSYDAYQGLLPGGKQARLLDYLVRLYAPDYLDYDVELHLDTSGLPRVQLGTGQTQLGRTAWLGKPNVPYIVQRIAYA